MPYLFALIALLALLFWQFPYALDHIDDKMQLAYWLALIVFIGGGYFASDRLGWKTHLKHMMGWLAIMAVIMMGYSYRDALLNNRLMAELLPDRPQIHGDGTMTLRADRYGQFHVRGQINGAPIKFLIDTGASDIALTKADAVRAGIDMDALKFTRVYQTANGKSFGADVRLHELVIGSIRVEGIEAHVAQGDMGGSLLGMTFLNQLSGYRVAGGELTLIP